MKLSNYIARPSVKVGIVLGILVFSGLIYGSFADASHKDSPAGNAIAHGLDSGTRFDFSIIDEEFDDDANPATVPQNITNNYAALGDSVASGAGLLVRSAGREDITCFRSGGAYPQMVSERTGLQLMHIACSGATAGDLVTSQGVSGPNIDAQLKRAFAQGKPRLISITAGANDVRWDFFLRKCIGRTCGSGTDSALLNAGIDVMAAKYRFALGSIYTRSHGNPPLTVLTGYYNPLEVSCAQTQAALTAEEHAWISAATNALNETIRQVAADYSFARYAPVSFSGHDYCAVDSWIQNFTDHKAPFHPTVGGQEAYANAVLSAAGSY